MIEQIKVTRWVGETLDNESLVIPLSDPALSGFAIMEISGIGSSKSDINVDESPSFDGAFFNSVHINSRNITLKLRYFFDPEKQTEDRAISVPNQRAYTNLESIRHTSYKYFRSKSRIRLTIKTDIRECYIDGYIESNEQNIFSKNSECNISIICPDPFFYSIFSSIDSIGKGEARDAFSFPFPSDDMSNKYASYVNKEEELYGIQGLYEMGISTETSRRVTIKYDGEIEIGAVFTIHLIGEDPSDKSITIYNTDFGESMYIDAIGVTKETGHTLATGDSIEISTIKGNKYCKLFYKDEFDDSYKVATLGFITFPKTNDWISIVGGDNTFAYRYEDSLGNLYQDQIRIDIETRIKYEGV